MPSTSGSPLVLKEGGLLQGRFSAMASPCELLLDSTDIAQGEQVFHAVVKEVARIEAKYSRYREDSAISALSRQAGTPTAIDEETQRLLAFATHLHQLSDGLFDISSGVLRKAWRFDGASAVPTQAMVDACLPHIGWHKVRLTDTQILMPAGMELDLGGIGKEYAVDRAFQIAHNLCDCAFLINLGGDLRTQGPRRDGSAWLIGVEQPDQAERAQHLIPITTAAVATSGDAKRFVLAEGGLRHGHLLNPKTGWPVVSGVRSVTVAAETCTTAGMLTSLSLLAPEGARAFLAQQEGIHSWVC
jgi:FAD:protein FMN transferase